MSDTSTARGGPSGPRTGKTPTGPQVAVIALAGVVALTTSAALTWSFRGWREDHSPPDTPASSATTPPFDREATLLKAGRLAYQVHCARCHGAEGHGDGSDAERLQPPPRDFASDGWRFTPDPDAVRRVIVAGIPGTAMPGWGSSLSAREMDGLVAQVMAFAPAPGEGSVVKSISSALNTLVARAGLVAEAVPGPAPPLVLRDLDDRPATLRERRGRPVLVLFWGTTCAHCLAEMPAVVRFVDRHRDSGLDLLPVCVDETDVAVIRDVAGPNAGGRPLYLDPDGSARLVYDVQSLPSYALIDRSGRLVARGQGGRDWSDPALDDLVRRGLAMDP